MIFTVFYWSVNYNTDTIQYHTTQSPQCNININAFVTTTRRLIEEHGSFFLIHADQHFVACSGDWKRFILANSLKRIWVNIHDIWFTRTKTMNGPTTILKWNSLQLNISSWYHECNTGNFSPVVNSYKTWILIWFLKILIYMNYSHRVPCAWYSSLVSTVITFGAQKTK